jgi:hypothetical protein
MALDLLPDNHPDIDPLRCSCRSPPCGKPNRPPPEWRRSSPARSETCHAPPGGTFVRQGRGRLQIWHSPLTRRKFAVPIGIPSRHTPATPFCARLACPKRSEPHERVGAADRESDPDFGYIRHGYLLPLRLRRVRRRNQR